MAKASMKQLEALHNALAVYFMEVLDSGEEISSGTLAAMNAFLKNNDIRVEAVDAKDSQNLHNTLRNLITDPVKEGVS